ncbi:MAG: D-alanine--D-alanine ligase [Treponema sp.]|jgi:D-alanine-D-alanine ligase|nr:D-alanine--D-alanine ligase [Treponema sp.]
MGKLKVGILCGGKSAEHEVSLQSAKNVFDAMDREKYEPVLIGIDKSGKWLYREAAKAEDLILNAGDPENIRINPDSRELILRPRSGGSLLIPGGPPSLKVDVIFPMLHGPFGEDGTVQGLLKLAELPFVGAGVSGSAVGMDKDLMKRLLRDGGVPIGKFLALRAHETLPPFADIVSVLGAPVFVKPANMGSSVGVGKVRDEAEYRKAAAEALQYDVKLILEEFIPGREIECSVLGNERPAASLPGEIRPGKGFYSYEAKYLDSAGAALEIPAKLSPETTAEVQRLAVKTFEILECQGLARVDFFLQEDGQVVVNEINTMPGFTKISMYPKLWEASGIPYSALISRLIELAIEKFAGERGLRTSYPLSCF